MKWRTNKTNMFSGNFFYGNGEGIEFGSYNQIGENVFLGRDVKIGNFCIIEDGCRLDDGVVLSNYIRLGPNTHLAKGVWMDSYTLASGNCYVGEYTQIRYQSIIARNVTIGPDCFFCAGVKTAYLDHTGNETKEPLRIGHRVFVGDNSTILAGLEVAPGAVIGAHSLVTRDCEDLDGIYVGCPAEFRRTMTLDELLRRSMRLEAYREKK